MNISEQQSLERESFAALADARTANVLEEALSLYKARNAEYKSNWQLVAPLMQVLYPKGVPAEQVANPIFHLVVLKLVKLTRFINSDLTHVDSMLDDCVYSAMIAGIIDTQTAKEQGHELPTEPTAKEQEVDLSKNFKFTSVVCRIGIDNCVTHLGGMPSVGLPPDAYIFGQFVKDYGQDKCRSAMEDLKKVIINDPYVENMMLKHQFLRIGASRCLDLMHGGPEAQTPAEVSFVNTFVKSPRYLTEFKDCMEYLLRKYVFKRPEDE